VVVEEVWTDGDAVIDESVVVVESADGSEEIVQDVLITDAQGDVVEIVMVEEVDEVQSESVSEGDA